MRTKLVACALLVAATLQAQTRPDYGPQVVFVFDHATDGHRYLVPKATAFFNVTPIQDTHPAPLNPQDLVICRTYTLHASNGTFLALKCGDDDYVVQGVGLKP